jgi:hypothetical protein
MTVIRTKNSSGQPVDKITHADPTPYANHRPNPNPVGSKVRSHNPAGGEVRIGKLPVKKIVPIPTIEINR